MQALIGLQRQAIRINDAASSIAGIARTTTANTPTTSAENRESHRSAAAISYQMAPSPPLPYSNTRTTPHAQMPRGNAVQGDSEPSPMQSLPGFNGGYWMGDAKDVDADYHSFTSTLIPPGPPFPPQQPHQTSIKSNSPGPHSSPSSGSSWRRRLTKTRSLTTIAGSVKRSLSTPNVQQAAAVSATAAAAVAAAAAADSLPYSTDKRRNKLGYHRTSVACGHCRRRKIRCLLAKDDPQGRCQNCIRLKKECNFYPVEASDRRPRSMSKTDISSQEPNSEASSPSPGLGGLGQLPFPEAPPRGYPASVPVTPTYDFAGSFDDSFRNSISGATGQLSISRSTNVSRKPSLAQMHVMPLALKADQGFLAPRDGFPMRSRWELPSQNELTAPITPISDQFRPAMEDPSSAFWRLTSGPPPNAPYVSSHNPDGVPPFGSLDQPDVQDEPAWRSQMLPGPYAQLGSTYSSDAEFPGAPGLVSASASTASLAASISEASQYGGGGGDVAPAPSQFYMNQWPAHSSYSAEGPMKPEQGPGASYYLEDDSPYSYRGHSPGHGPPAVRISSHNI